MTTPNPSAGGAAAGVATATTGGGVAVAISAAILSGVGIGTSGPRRVDRRHGSTVHDQKDRGGRRERGADGRREDHARPGLSLALGRVGALAPFASHALFVGRKDALGMLRVRDQRSFSRLERPLEDRHLLRERPLVVGRHVGQRLRVNQDLEPELLGAVAQGEHAFAEVSPRISRATLLHLQPRRPRTTTSSLRLFRFKARDLGPETWQIELEPRAAGQLTRRFFGDA
jgi:hypothetical protein